MAVIADVDLAPVEALDAEPLDEGLLQRAMQAGQHGLPGLHLHGGAALQPARQGIEPPPGIAFQGLRLFGQQLGEPPRHRLHRLAQGLERDSQGIAAFEQLLDGRADLAFHAVGVAGAIAAGVDLLTDQRQESFDRVCRLVAQALPPAFARQAGRCLQHRFELFRQLFVLQRQVVEAPAQPAHAAFATRRFSPEQPAPQLLGLQAAQVRGEGAVGGLEEVVRLVEDIAQR